MRKINVTVFVSKSMYDLWPFFTKQILKGFCMINTLRTLFFSASLFECECECECELVTLEKEYFI